MNFILEKLLITKYHLKVIKIGKDKYIKKIGRISVKAISYNIDKKSPVLMNL